MAALVFILQWRLAGCVISAGWRLSSGWPGVAASAVAGYGGGYLVIGGWLPGVVSLGSSAGGIRVGCRLCGANGWRHRSSKLANAMHLSIINQPGHGRKVNVAAKCPSAHGAAAENQRVRHRGAGQPVGQLQPAIHRLALDKCQWRLGNLNG